MSINVKNYYLEVYLTHQTMVNCPLFELSLCFTYFTHFVVYFFNNYLWNHEIHANNIQTSIKNGLIKVKK